MLKETLPKAVQRQRSSLTISTSSWSFCTKEAMESFLADRKAMWQHVEMLPKMRTYLWVVFHVKQELFEVWEVVDRVPPSTALELEPSQISDGPQGCARSALQEELPGLVMEVSSNGEVVTWPGPDVLEEA